MMAPTLGLDVCATRYPCSIEQTHRLAAVRTNPDDPAHNASMRWRLRGDVSHAVLERAWSILVARHEMLRAHFAVDEERFEQIVEPALATHVAVVDCSALAPEIVESEVAHIAATDARAPFDLSVAPLWRVTRLVLGTDDSVLLVTAHQLACDGWSFGLVARELGEICAALGAGREPDLAPLSTTFGAFAQWQTTIQTDDALREELDLLRSDLAGEFAVDIPTDMVRPALWTSRVHTRTKLLDSAITRAFVAEARAAGSTPFAAMLATAARVLSERSASPAVVISTQVVGRDDVDLENIVGPFVNSMPLRIEVPAAASLSEVLATVGVVLANALELRHVPFARVAEGILPPAGPDRGGVCGINFLYQKAFTQDRDYGSFRIESEHSLPAGSQYDLNIYVVERSTGWRLSCDYNPDLFAVGTIDAIIGRFEQMLSGGIDRREAVLFFHSDLFADGYYAHEVAAAIASRRIIPVEPHGIGGRALLPTIDAMAADYVANIEAIQPAGPYRLLGFCSGALVAFEVARLLKERGERVDALVLINATAPVRPLMPFRDRIILATARNARLSPALREAICYNVARFNRALLRGPAATLRFIGTSVLSLFRRGRASAARPTQETFVRAAGDAVSELSFAHIGAALAHHPHAYDGEVTLIWSVDQVNLTGDPTQGWNRLATSVKTVPMSGGHVAPLHELIGELSNILRRIL